MAEFLGDGWTKGEAFSGKRRSRSRGISPDDEQRILSEVAQETAGVIGAFGHALDSVGAGVRHRLAGGTFSEGFFSSPEERLSGRDLLREYGLTHDEDTWGNYLLGVGVEIATDPLSYITGPAGALTSAGKAAKRAGLLDDAAKALSRKYVSARQSGNAASVGAEVAQRAKAGYDKALARGKTVVTDSDLYSRPLIGKRAAQKYGTLDDLIAHADNPKAAEDALTTALGRGNAKAGQQALNKIRHQRLANDIGLATPLGDVFATANLGKYGDVYTDALDAIGSATRWSAPGRLAAMAFDKRVGSQFTEEAQMAGIAGFGKAKARREAATREGISALSKLRRDVPDAFNEDGGQMLGRLIEGGQNVTQKDIDYRTNNPAVDEYIKWWETYRDDVLASSQDIGLRSDKLKDPYGLGYLPYQADPMFEMAASQNSQLADSLSTMTGDMMRRGKTLRLPGGRDQIMQLSQDPRFSGPKRTLTTDAAAAGELAVEVFGKPLSALAKEQKKQMESLAVLLHRLPEEATKRAPLFGQHPAQMIQQYIEGRATAAGNMDALIDGVTSYAVDTAANQVSRQGRGNITIAEALKRIGARTKNVNGVQYGGKAQVRDRLAKALGINPNQINLSNYSIPLERVEALIRSEDVFSNPAAKNEFMKAIDAYTSLWKGSILAFPSRITRDIYSGLFSNWLVGGLSEEGVRSATALLNEGPNSRAFLQTLDSLPQYRHLPSVGQRIDAFYGDLAATELISGGSKLDRLHSLTGESVLDRMPGQRPVSLLYGEGSAAGELASLPRSVTNGDFFEIPTAMSPYKDLKNPILRAGDKANTFSDGLNRLSGYLTLMKKGYSPASAADAMKRVQVDYSSLSSFERNWLRRVFPWYSYQSRIMREVLGQMAARPGGRYGQTVQAIHEGQQESSGDGEYVPSYLRERIAVPLYSGETGTVYMNSFDGPGFDQFSMLNPYEADRTVSSQLAPQYRIPMEWISGRDFYHDRPLRESRSGIASNAYRAVTGGELPGGWLADRVIGSTPFLGRPAQVAAKLMDDRSGVPFGERAALTALDVFTGFKFTPVDQAAIDADLNRQLNQSVEDDPNVRESSRLFVPQDREADTPQRVLERLKLQQQRARRRQQQGPTIQ